MFSSVAPPDQKQPARPDGVSETNWKKFQELKERRLKLSKQAEGRKRSKVHKKPRSILPETQTEDNQNDTSQPVIRENEKCNELKQDSQHPSNLETPNSHPNDSINEEMINKAIEKGELEEAESLSDQLATKELLSKATQAFKTRDFAEKRKAQEEQKQEKKRRKKKLHWGFEQKQRWESKGNM